MMQDHALELLKDIDAVEAEMRSLESKLTLIRMRLHRYAGVSQRYDLNGSKVLSEAQKEELKRLDDATCPF